MPPVRESPVQGGRSVRAGGHGGRSTPAATAAPKPYSARRAGATAAPEDAARKRSRPATTATPAPTPVATSTADFGDTPTATAPATAAFAAATASATTATAAATAPATATATASATATSSASATSSATALRSPLHTLRSSKVAIGRVLAQLDGVVARASRQCLAGRARKEEIGRLCEALRTVESLLQEWSSYFDATTTARSTPNSSSSFASHSVPISDGIRTPPSPLNPSSLKPPNLVAKSQTPKVEKMESKESRGVSLSPLFNFPSSQCLEFDLISTNSELDSMESFGLPDLTPPDVFSTKLTSLNFNSDSKKGPKFQASPFAGKAPSDRKDSTPKFQLEQKKVQLSDTSKFSTETVTATAVETVSSASTGAAVGMEHGKGAGTETGTETELKLTGIGAAIPIFQSSASQIVQKSTYKNKRNCRNRPYTPSSELKGWPSPSREVLSELLRLATPLAKKEDKLKGEDSSVTPNIETPFLWDSPPTTNVELSENWTPPAQGMLSTISPFRTSGAPLLHASSQGNMVLTPSPSPSLSPRLSFPTANVIISLPPSSPSISIQTPTIHFSKGSVIMQDRRMELLQSPSMEPSLNVDLWQAMAICFKLQEMGIEDIFELSAVKKRSENGLRSGRSTNFIEHDVGSVRGSGRGRVGEGEGEGEGDVSNTPPLTVGEISPRRRTVSFEVASREKRRPSNVDFIEGRGGALVELNKVKFTAPESDLLSVRKEKSPPLS